ncbi:MAG TPA: transcription termination/antitermination protein NusA [Firmicutes bacterium]|nr:transcription termination/antitermination protein NusA [Bacillota bacterium]
MNLELVGALTELEKERGISKDIIYEAIEAAIVSAYKRNYGSAQNIRVQLTDKGEIKVFARKDVVEEVMDEANEISLEDARAIDPNYQLDDVVELEVTPRDFGRIAAQTAKQVVIQRIREAEREMIYEEFQNREGDIVTGIVQRTEHRHVLVDLGKVEAVLPPSEQVPRENYTHGMRMKVYVTEVRKTTKGPQVIVSRTHPNLLKRLFELEVPEIQDGIVEIKAVAREAGNRSKIAVHSVDPNVDPVGACVGPRGMRVQAVVQELKGEKVDIIMWHPNPEQFIANSLSPSRVLRVQILEGDKMARTVVPDHQLSLAIGKEGQNARLAARVTGWKIDIKSESQMQELLALEAKRMFAIPESSTPEAPEEKERGEGEPAIRQVKEREIDFDQLLPVPEKHGLNAEDLFKIPHAGDEKEEAGKANSPSADQSGERRTLRAEAAFYEATIAEGADKPGKKAKKSKGKDKDDEGKPREVIRDLSELAKLMDVIKDDGE